VAQAGFILVIILGLAVLMVVHELGHHVVARAFGLRVLRFSIGFGPALWRHQPRGSETIYQVALIPFLAYVQVAGMNPFEESDPNDKGSYANASLTARVATIAAGPFANYFFGSLLVFGALMVFGQPEASTQVNVEEQSPAAAGQMLSGDRIVRIDETAINTFEDLQEVIQKSPGRALRVSVLREEKPVDLVVTPDTRENGTGLIGVRPITVYASVDIGDATKAAIAFPAEVVKRLLSDLGRMLTRQGETPDVTGPVGIVKIGARIAEQGPLEFFFFMATLSAYLGGFNLLPVPALDGGRLLFLGYEAVARRKPNAKVEAHIHALGLLMFLALIAVVTVRDFQRDPTAETKKPAPSAAPVQSAPPK
jgi:regulator of sigma E protease